MTNNTESVTRGLVGLVGVGFLLLVGCSESGPSGQSAAEVAAREIATTIAPAAGGPAKWFDLNTPEGQLRAYRRIQCSDSDDDVITYGWRGRAYGRVKGMADKHLFNLEGMNIRRCVTVEDPEKGTGFRFVTREVLLYLDPETNEVLRTWRNPYTGKLNQVLHVANDPVNQRPSFTKIDDRDFALPFQFNGDYWWFTQTVPLFYSNPLGGDYQPYIGGTYHATEMFNFIGDLNSLTNEAVDSADVAVGWVRMSSWLPWMEMQDRDGVIYMHTAGRKLNSYDELPDVMKNEIAANYPKYTEPPPPDDDRRNETSWTYFKKMVESGEFTGSKGLEAE